MRMYVHNSQKDRFAGKPDFLRIIHIHVHDSEYVLII